MADNGEATLEARLVEQETFEPSEEFVEQATERVAQQALDAAEDD